jgi:hypothetical protein
LPNVGEFDCRTRAGLGELYLRQGRTGDAVAVAEWMEKVGAPESAQTFSQRVSGTGIGTVTKANG